MKVLEIVAPVGLLGTYQFILEAGDILLVVEVYKSSYGIRVIPKFNDITEIQSIAERFVYDLLERQALSRGIEVCMSLYL